MENKILDIAVIGAGPAGLTAGIYGARGGMETAVFAGPAAGGQLLQTMDIENFPGFPNPISGFDLMTKVINQAKRLGSSVISEEVKEIEVCCSPFKLRAGNSFYQAKTLIIATGAQAKWLGLASESKFIGKGVSGCATCDGFFYKGKDVCVIGGGDTAAEDALFLTKFANKVYLIHRRDQLRAAYILQEKLKNNPKIEIIYDHIAEEFSGKDKLEAVTLKNVKTGEKKILQLPGAFIAIGHTPNTSLFKDKVRLDDQGYVIINSKYETSVEGVYAAGDVCDQIYKQAIVAAGSGCMAAMNAIKYLETK
ncbi:MAG: thioredoxin-disulfide reductase [Elusimicrobia bacterium]|nr:thioredoxin-disulfide reductase [Elusimicrobiota bacterium]